MTNADSKSRAALRKTFRQRRAALGSAQQQRHGLAALQQLQHATDLHNVRQAGLYFSTSEELDSGPILDYLLTRNVIVGLPAITDRKAGTMVFRRHHKGAPLTTGALGLSEPLATATELAIADFDLLFMPLVAFDDQGHRLGMGGGFYDRALGAVAGAARPVLIGLAHSVQHSESPLPNAEWDIPLDAVLTERGLITYSARGQRTFS
ncbi:MAG: 5-formyltetrahydrofolate cyclo-ligase [Pseudomonadales bacterium]